MNLKEEMNKVVIKFENKFIILEIPCYSNFTGETTISLHWKNGKIMKTDVIKKATSELIYLENS